MVRQVIYVYKRTDAEERIPAIYLEINYELATLYDAMQVDDTYTMENCKKRLEELRQELFRLEVW